MVQPGSCLSQVGADPAHLGLEDPAVGAQRKARLESRVAEGGRSAPRWSQLRRGQTMRDDALHPCCVRGSAGEAG